MSFRIRRENERLYFLCRNLALLHSSSESLHHLSVDTPGIPGTRMMQAPELILCNSYLQMGTEMHGDCRSTCLLSSAHCSGQRYLSSYKNDFPHITRNLWMRRLLYPACPKCFFLKVRQARSLRSCSCRGLQVQFCVGPLCFF